MNTFAFLCHAYHAAAVLANYQPRWAWLLGGAVAGLAWLGLWGVDRVGRERD